MKRILSLSFLLVVFALNSTPDATVYSPIQMRLAVDGTPSPGNTFSLLCTLSTDIDTVITATVSIELEAGLATTGGSTAISFVAPITNGVPYIHNEPVVASDAGTYQVDALMWAQLDSSYTPGAGDLFYVCVSVDPDSAGAPAASGEISTNGMIYGVEAPDILQLNYKSPVYEAMESLPLDSIANQGEGNDSIYGGPEQTSGTLTVTGQYVYIDPDEAQQPLVNATVEIWDSDNFLCGTNDLLGVGTTNDNGEYSVTVDNGDCSGTVDVYVIGLPENSRVRIRDRDVTGATYEYRFTTSTVDNAGSGVLDMGVYHVQSSTYGQRAVWIFEWMNRAWMTMRQTTGYQMRSQNAYVGFRIDLILDSFGANFFCSSQAINIHSAAAQSFDICVHEYGHSVQHWFGDKTCGACNNPHFWNVPNTLECAMDEGFADFLPVALNDDQQFNWHENSWRSLEYPLSELLNKTFSEALHTEGNVAVSLYDFYDNNNDTNPSEPGGDFYNGGLGEILDVFSNHSAAGGFATYWAKWKLNGNSSHLPVQILRNNRIDLNTPPAWGTIPDFSRQAFTEVVVAVDFYVSDDESTDDELIVIVESNSNQQVTADWFPGPELRLNILTSDGTGAADIRLEADDGLESRLSNTFRVIWTGGGGGGGGGGKDPPPNPCEGVCPMSQPDVTRTALGRNSPNPFNPGTQIPFSLHKKQLVSLRVYDVEGKLIRNLFDGAKRRGLYQMYWDGRDNKGHQQGSGIYFSVLVTESYRFTSKMLLLK